MFRRLNLFGGPGLGKSRLAARIYSDLKEKDFSIELVREYVKKWAYLDRKLISFDQVYVFGKQLHAEDHLLQKNRVDLTITDSPMMLNVAYAKIYGYSFWQSLLEIAKDFEKTYPSVNILVERNGLPYIQKGRYETEQEAIKRDKEILDFLSDHLNSNSFLAVSSIEYDNSFIEKLIQVLNSD